MSQIKKGAILSYLLVFISIIIALVYTPIIIRLLGQSEYGLYAMIGSLATYFNILDLGLGNTIIRYISRNRAIGNKVFETKLNGMFLVIYLIIGLITIIAGLTFYINFENIFSTGLSNNEITKARIMIIILTINFALSFPLSVFSSFIQAYEKFVFLKTVEIIRIILIPLIIIPILLIGYGAISMVLVTTFVNLSILLINVYYCFKYLGISFYFGKIDFELLKEILSYSFFVFLAVIVDRIYWNTDQLILGAMVGTIPVAIYAISMQIINIYMKFSTSISGLFLPRASIMIAKNSSNKVITDSMIKYGRIQFIILVYILSGFILFGRPFINFWAGSNYDKAYIITLIIMIPLTIPLFQNFGLSILYAKNMQKFRTIMLIFIAILNVIITIPLVKNFESIGAAIGTAISLFLGNTLIMNIYYHNKVGINMLRFWNSILKLIIPTIISLFIGFGINFIINPNNIYLMPINIIIFTIIFITFYWVIGFNAYEKNLAISLFNKILKDKLRK